MAKTLFRADSGAKVGLGHISRDLVFAARFAERFKFDKIEFACLDLEGNVNAQIPYPVHILKSGDASEISNLIINGGFETIVIDNYAIDADFERALKETAGAKIIAFDDERKPHFCDVLVAPGVWTSAEDYAGLVPAGCEILAGFSLVRDEFYAEREIRREKIYDYFVCLGGSDVKNATARVALSLPNTAKIAIATTSANSNLNSLKALAASRENISLFVDFAHMARLMNESEVLHISASTLVSEASVLGAKFVAYRVAENQTRIYEYLKKTGVECHDLA